MPNEDDEHQDVPTPVALAEPLGPQSPIEALRAKRDEIEAKREVYIPILGYEEIGLKAKYRLLDRAETTDIGKRVKQQTKGKGQSEFMFRILVDTIIAACEGLYLAPMGVTDEDAEPLMNQAKTDPILTYAAFAAEMRGESFPNHRAAVIYCFGDNEFAVGQHGLLLQRWLTDTNIDIDEELLGE